MTATGKQTEEERAPRTATPGSLLSQWWTLGDIILDRRTNGSGRHTKVAWVIIDRYMQAKGNGRASVRFIEQATGLSKGIIIKACRELVDWGYMTQRIGIGTRPTEFSPNWSSVSPVSNAKRIVASVPQESNACVPQESNTTDFSVPPESNESYLRDRPTKAGLTLSRTEDAHGIAQLGPYGAAALPRDPEGFDELYKAYSLRRKRAEAKSVYEKIAPDADLHARMVEAAGQWHSSYEENGTDIKWRKHLHSWLAKECWEEDPPVAYVDSKEAAIAKAKERGPKPKPANSNTPPAGINDAYIIGIEQVNDAYHHDFKLTLSLQYDETGQIITHRMEVNTITGPGADNDAFWELCAAMEPYNLRDISQAMGLPVKTATLGKGKLGFGKSFLDARDITEEVEIVKSEMHHDEGEDFLYVTMKTPNDMELEWHATYESPSREERLAGRKEIAKLMIAVGLDGVHESELVGKKLTVCRHFKNIIGLLPHPENEQQQAA